MFSRFRTVVNFLTLFSVEWFVFSVFSFFSSVYSGVVFRSVIVGASRKYWCFGTVTSFLLCVGKQEFAFLSGRNQQVWYGQKVSCSQSESADPLQAHQHDFHL